MWGWSVNRARVAALFRELSDEFASEDHGSTPKPRAARLPVVPPGEFDELTRARVKATLRRKGYRDVG